MKTVLAEYWKVSKQRHTFFDREDISLQTLLLLFKCANHRNKRPFVLIANEALVGIFMTMGDVSDIFPITDG